jgi:uncharacterized protein (TIGR00730 family)
MVKATFTLENATVSNNAYLYGVTSTNKLMKHIAVFCGSSDGYNDSYREQAYQAGIGIMGAIADGVLNGGGKVTGVIPHFLQTKEIVHDALTELIVVNTMHERKLRMYELCQGVLILPGGWGTMEEMFEMLTWGQLGMHEKPIGILNINGYYDALNAFNSTMVQEGFLDECTRSILMYSDSLEELLGKMENYTAPELPKLINKQTT